MDEILKTVAQFFKAEWSSEDVVDPVGGGCIRYYDSRFNWDVFYSKRTQSISIMALEDGASQPLFQFSGCYQYAEIVSVAPDDEIQSLYLYPEGATDKSNGVWITRFVSGRIQLETSIGFPHNPQTAQQLEKSKTQAT